MILQNLARKSELQARRWTTRPAGPSAGMLSILRDLAQIARIPKDVGNRTARWQAPSSGSRSTRTPRAQERARDGRRQIVIAEARARGRIGGRLHGARIGIVGTETVVIAGGRAEKDEETDEGTIVVPDARDVGAGRRTARPEATGVSERRGRSERISKGCPEPQPWARLTTERPRVQAVGALLGALLPAEPFRPQPVMVMRSPKAKVARLPRDVASPVR